MFQTTAQSKEYSGCKVALVQSRPVLGGNNSSEIGVHTGRWGIQGRCP